MECLAEFREVKATAIIKLIKMTIEQREQAFKETVFRMISFSADIIQSFFDYWSEPNKSGTKMRFELEKTWDLNRRMRRWQTMGDTRKDFQVSLKKVDTSMKPAMPAPITEIEKLDAFLQSYIDRPTQIPFAEFGKWYPYMKEQKLLKPFTTADVMELKRVYNNDNMKCRCACVQLTLDGYVRGGITVGTIYQLRMKLA